LLKGYITALPNELTPYQPMGLLPIVSKVYEKLLLKSLHSMVENSGLILQAEVLHNKNRHIKLYEA
jgi:hypothetical protein